MASSEDLSSTINRLTGGLITAILVALILWIGQTTFRHAAILTALDEKLNDVKHQFEIVDQRQEELRKQFENAISDAKDSSRSQFTAKDGDALVSQVRQAEQSMTDLERKFVERLNGLELRLAALETQHQHSQEVAALQSEITQLRSDITRATVVQEAQSQQTQTGDRFARGMPVFLPPVDNRR
jgi:predicted nuclease with TOPRIM domain